MIDYVDMVATLCKDPAKIQSEMSPVKAHLIHMVLGISGEAGELLDAVKKYAIYNKHLDRENVIEELGDLEFYMEGLRAYLNISRTEVLEANVTKLSARYEGMKYTDQRAQERADKNA